MQRINGTCLQNQGCSKTSSGFVINNKSSSSPTKMMDDIGGTPPPHPPTKKVLHYLKWSLTAESIILNFLCQDTMGSIIILLSRPQLDLKKRRDLTYSCGLQLQQGCRWCEWEKRWWHECVPPAQHQRTNTKHMPLVEQLGTTMALSRVYTGAKAQQCP